MRRAAGPRARARACPREPTTKLATPEASTCNGSQPLRSSCAARRARCAGVARCDTGLWSVTTLASTPLRALLRATPTCPKKLPPHPKEPETFTSAMEAKRRGASQKCGCSTKREHDGPSAERAASYFSQPRCCRDLVGDFETPEIRDFCNRGGARIATEKLVAEPHADKTMCLETAHIDNWFRDELSPERLSSGGSVHASKLRAGHAHELWSRSRRHLGNGASTDLACFAPIPRRHA